MAFLTAVPLLQQDVGCSGERGSASFRFWHDERRFKGRGDQCIVQKALFAAGKLPKEPRFVQRGYVHCNTCLGHTRTSVMLHALGRVPSATHGHIVQHGAFRLHVCCSNHMHPMSHLHVKPTVLQ